MHFALKAHSRQNRKGTRVPYASHLFAVASTVLDYGGNEDQAIAALLHDSIEDQGVTAGQLRRLFGDNVATMVVACSDSLQKDPAKKAPWHQRKQTYLEHLKKAAAPVLLISAADKLHNARSILKDYRRLGDRVWRRFNAGRKDILWYYDTLVEVLQARGRHQSLVEELARTVAGIHRISRRPSGSDGSPKRRIV